MSAFVAEKTIAPAREKCYKNIVLTVLGVAWPPQKTSSEDGRFSLSVLGLDDLLIA